MKPLQPNIDVQDSARWQFIGILLNCSLYGLLLAQTCIYWATFPRDMRVNKAIVCVVFFLETAQTVLLSHDQYQTFVVHFGDAQVLERIGLLWFTVPLLSGIVSWIAQLFYAWRIYKISRCKRISAVVTLLSCVQLGTAITEGMRARSALTFPGLRVQQDLKSVLSGAFWMITMVACDIIIATVMTYYLLKLRKEFYCDSSFFIRRLLTLTVETGSITALAALLASILFISRPNSEAFNLPGFTIGKLYSNSLLRVLNSRHRTDSTGEVFTFPISAESPASSHQASTSRDGQPQLQLRPRRRDPEAAE